MDKKPQPLSIDEYLAPFPSEQRALLESIRATIRQAAPDATEAISYGIPTFRLRGSYLIYFAGYKKHSSVYPIPDGDDAFNNDVNAYRTGKGTLQFPYDTPIPHDLIRRAVGFARIANERRTVK